MTSMQLLGGFAIIAMVALAIAGILCGASLVKGAVQDRKEVGWGWAVSMGFFGLFIAAFMFAFMLMVISSLTPFRIFQAE